MADSLEDDALCAKGLAVLEDHLGPVQALRFLALISRQPFDYQHWRQQHFGKTEPRYWPKPERPKASCNSKGP